LINYFVVFGTFEPKALANHPKYQQTQILD